MNRLTEQILGILAAVLVFGGCSNGSNSEPAGGGTVTVTFNLGYEGAAEIPAISLNAGRAAGSLWPNNPALFYYTFDGWLDGGGTQYTRQTTIQDSVTVTAQWSVEDTSILEGQSSGGDLAALFNSKLPANLSNSWKIYGHRNPLITQGFGADPTTVVYNNRLYVYASNDSMQYDAGGNPTARSFETGIQGLRIISSADLSNWTDHGVIRPGGQPESTNPLIPEEDLPQITPYDSKSWAPSATWKMVNGKPKFFLYFANSGNGVGVITADSPTGPWTSPLSKLLIDRSTPNCVDVEYLFDPGVFIDDDGKGYLFFGGGNTDGMARRVALNADMISLAGTPQSWIVPDMFEASDMFKYNNRYYFSYSSRTGTYSIPGEGQLAGTEIAYLMTTDYPMGSFRPEVKGILKSASTQLGSGDTNNHQNIFVFKDKVYIAYHAAKVAEAMGTWTGNNHRSTFIDEVTIGTDSLRTIQPVTMTRKGVDPVGTLDPYVVNEAETIGIMGGIYTRADTSAGNGMVVTSIDTGDWVALYNVDFGGGATKFAARVRTPDTAGYSGAIELRIDPTGAGVTTDTGNLTTSNTAQITGGTVIGRAWIKANSGEEGRYATVTIDLDEPVTSVHNLVFVFYSSLNGGNARPETAMKSSPHKNAFEFDQWQFFE